MTLLFLGFLSLFAGPLVDFNFAYLGNLALHKRMNNNLPRKLR